MVCSVHGNGGSGKLRAGSIAVETSSRSRVDYYRHLTALVAGVVLLCCSPAIQTNTLSVDQSPRITATDTGTREPCVELYVGVSVAGRFGKEFECHHKTKVEARFKLTSPPSLPT